MTTSDKPYQLSPRLRAEVEKALGSVLDPCSVFNGTRLSFLELGMIQSLESRYTGHIGVRLLLDDPVCIYLGQITHEVREAILTLDGVDSVDVEYSGDDIWTEELASESTRARILARREQLRKSIAQRSSKPAVKGLLAVQR